MIRAEVFHVSLIPGALIETDVRWIEWNIDFCIFSSIESSHTDKKICVMFWTKQIVVSYCTWVGIEQEHLN